MNYNKIIITLVIVLVVIVAAGVFFLNPGHAKVDSKVIVTSNSTLNDGDNFTIKLADLNNTPIANQTVNVTIIDANGGKNPQIINTDANGDGSLQLNGLAVGNYTINVTYGGNENYTSCNTTQKLEMKEKVVSSQTSSSTYSSSASSQKRTYADIAHDSDVHTNPEKSKLLNDHIVGGKDGITYFSDGSYVDMR